MIPTIWFSIWHIFWHYTDAPLIKSRDPLAGGEKIISRQLDKPISGVHRCPTFSTHLGSKAVSPSSCTRLRLSYDEAQRCPRLSMFPPYFACAVLPYSTLHSNRVQRLNAAQSDPLQHIRIYKVKKHQQTWKNIKKNQRNGRIWKLQVTNTRASWPARKLLTSLSSRKDSKSL